MVFQMGLSKLICLMSYLVNEIFIFRVLLRLPLMNEWNLKWMNGEDIWICMAKAY